MDLTHTTQTALYQLLATIDLQALGIAPLDDAWLWSCPYLWIGLAGRLAPLKHSLTDEQIAEVVGIVEQMDVEIYPAAVDAAAYWLGLVGRTPEPIEEWNPPRPSGRISPQATYLKRVAARYAPDQLPWWLVGYAPVPTEAEQVADIARRITPYMIDMLVLGEPISTEASESIRRATGLPADECE